MKVFDVGFWLGVFAGGALIWFTKAWLQKAFLGTSGFIAKMEADVAALKAKVTPAAPVAPAPAPSVTTKSS